MSLLDSPMQHSVRIVPQIHVQDDELGDRVSNLTSDNEPVVCWIQNLSRSDLVEWQKRMSNIGMHVFFNSDVGLEEDDRVEVVKGPLNHVGRTYKVRAYAERSAGFNVLFGAICELDR